METKSSVEVLELRRLLYEIQERNSHVCIRLRMMGAMWFPHFMSIIAVTEKGVLLRDEVSSHLVVIQNLKNVIQFEIDNQLHNFQPHFHYDVKLSQQFA
jgi:hypothetical protein